MNLTDRRAARARDAQLALVAEGPDRALALARDVLGKAPPEPATPLLPHLALPAHHDVREDDVVMRRLHAALAAASERGPTDFADLLLTPGLGARTLATLALVAEVVHGAPSRFSDPARFSFALGGKDGHPFPVPLAVYDETLTVLRNAVSRAKLGNDDRLAALEKLDSASRRLEVLGADGPGFESLVAREGRDSHRHGGRSVHGRSRPQRKPRPKQKGQLALPGIEEPR